MAAAEEDDSRQGWRIGTYVIIACILLFNLVLIGLLIYRRRDLRRVSKTTILGVAVSDLLFGVFVAPFFVQNYVDNLWDVGLEYCRFFNFYFTFHDNLTAFALVFLSVCKTIKFTGLLSYQKKAGLVKGVVCVALLVLSSLLALPATIHSEIITDVVNKTEIKECRTLDIYTMPIIYISVSSLLFCFAMFFFLSLCLIGSPLFKDVFDQNEYRDRFKGLLKMSLVNGLFIVSAFLLNFKEVSRFFSKCCDIHSPFAELNNSWYDSWSFCLYASKAVTRTIVFILLN